MHKIQFLSSFKDHKSFFYRTPSVAPFTSNFKIHKPVVLCKNNFIKKRSSLSLYPANLQCDKHDYFPTFSTDLLASYFVEQLAVVVSRDLKFITISY